MTSPRWPLFVDAHYNWPTSAIWSTWTPEQRLAVSKAFLRAALEREVPHGAQKSSAVRTSLQLLDLCHVICQDVL